MTSRPSRSSSVRRSWDSICAASRAAEAFPELQALSGWLAKGYAGRMTYLNRTAKKRADVRHWLPSARSVICVGVRLPHRPAAVGRTRRPRRALIARYAWGDDYHDVLRRRGSTRCWPGCARPPRAVRRPHRRGRRARCRSGCTRRTPASGGLARTPASSIPTLGSWFVLGEIATSLALEPDEPVLDQCGTCQLCLDACPTQAIVEPLRGRCAAVPVVPDASRSRRTFPKTQRPDLGAHVFGCDICQDVCPYNAGVPHERRPGVAAAPGLDQPRARRPVARGRRGARRRRSTGRRCGAVASRACGATSPWRWATAGAARMPSGAGGPAARCPSASEPDRAPSTVAWARRAGGGRKPGRSRARSSFCPDAAQPASLHTSGHSHGREACVTCAQVHLQGDRAPAYHAHYLRPRAICHPLAL